jgi:hypothetical protein
VRIDIITIFPGYFEPLSMSLIGKAAGEATSSSPSTTCGRGRVMFTTPWTTRPMAAARGW